MMLPEVRVTLPLYEFPFALSQVAIALPEIIRQTDAFSIKRRPGCAPTLIKSIFKDLFWEYRVTCNENYSDPSGHDVRVKFDQADVERAPRTPSAWMCKSTVFIQLSYIGLRNIILINWTIY